MMAYLPKQTSQQKNVYSSQALLKKTWPVPTKTLSSHVSTLLADTVFARISLPVSLGEGGPFSPSMATGTLGHPWPAAALVAHMLPESMELKVILSD
ncbi:hypothetical protein [Desulfosporosinus sp. OT]|uniref:hypothetical protein n=1 Tax=Desulfosporosinus sp. OT TaxID=913865 RepID=UPI001A9A214D|nr:hypothetical protein [Desulfosporosinus sp. OT]